MEWLLPKDRSKDIPGSRQKNALPEIIHKPIINLLLSNDHSVVCIVTHLYEILETIFSIPQNHDFNFLKVEIVLKSECK